MIKLSKINNFFSLIQQIRRKRKAVSTVLATVVIFGLIIIGVTIGFFQVIPHIERSQAETAYTSVLTSIIQVDNSVQELINEGSNSATFLNPTRVVQINKPAGSLELIPNAHTLNLDFVDAAGDSILDDDGEEIERLYDSDISLGEFVYTLTTNYAFTPEGSTKYLTGSDPFINRPTAVFQSPVQGANDDLYQGLDNIFSTRINREQFIHYNYRSLIVVDFKALPEPTISVTLFAIRLTGNELAIYSTYSDLSLKLTSIDTSHWNRSIDDTVNEVVIRYRTEPNQLAWTEGFSSANIAGFSASYYKIDFKSYIYNFELSQ